MDARKEGAPIITIAAENCYLVRSLDHFGELVEIRVGWPKHRRSGNRDLG